MRSEGNYVKIIKHRDKVTFTLCSIVGLKMAGTSGPCGLKETLRKTINISDTPV
jgi:hypothetical protein